MSNLVLNHDHVVPVGVEASDGPVTRLAFYVTSRGRSLFVWHHHAAQERQQDHAVLICAPAGHEQVHSHRSLRHLADQLAGVGFRVVRFDFLGAGDSADFVESASPYADWLANIQDVLGWMKRHLKSKRVSLMGLRLGATLAMQAAAEVEIENMVLWQPIVRGRAYARELKALSMIGVAAPRASPPAAGLEAAGFVYSNGLLDELGQVDLLKISPRCARALILSRDDVASDLGLFNHFQANLVEVEHGPLPGYADMLAEPHFTQIPHQAIAATMNWLRRTDGSDSDRLHRIEGTAEDSNAEPRSALMAPGVCERAVTISKTPRLFGILSEPVQHADLPVVILSNAGAAYRAGPGRLYVMLSRRLATLGFCCLRLDLAGLGDSVSVDEKRENDSYPATAFRDIDLAIKFVQHNLGVRRVVVMGLCSGAYVAFQSAGQVTDPALIEAILVNPLTFFWKDGMKIEDSSSKHHSDFLYYKSAALQPRNWLKLLRGQTSIGIGGAVKLVARQLGFRKPRVDATGGTDKPHALGHPAVDDLNGDLERVEAKSRHLACFFSRSDPGWSLMTYQAGRMVNRLCAAGRLSVDFIEDADHTFSQQHAREEFLNAVARHLTKRYVGRE
ncbi:MAG: alpha/beta fold hydrolase [Planctomycetes bacterium]|nr:alpha/beta fold hydrolase [Planctomycetota bacterium]